MQFWLRPGDNPVELSFYGGQSINSKCVGQDVLIGCSTVTLDKKQF
jgi:hypothetical protein